MKTNQDINTKIKELETEIEDLEEEFQERLDEQRERNAQAQIIRRRRLFIAMCVAGGSVGTGLMVLLWGCLV